ncbi:uncharacterized protein LOC101848383 [Aplysia californica]|uniref:Uncharacterized protein LOC101848383 n=1 Tax=Aplysia californica TaxID=6500 RepID=A0ABM1A9M5_APLCA|nr:uncharacterized protein LOC101848383 [Aplysia californica]
MGVIRVMDPIQPYTISLGGDFEGNFRHQISSVVDMIIARKMRVSVPETSRLAVQPLGSSQASPGPQVMPVASAHSAPSLSSEDQMAPAAHHLSRRYSKPQADEEGDVAEVSNQLLSRFSQTVTLSTGRLLRRGSGHINLYEKSSAQLQETSIPEAGELTSRVSVMPRSSLTRGSSSPNLQGMAQSAGMGGSNNSGGGLISRYLRRRGSMDTILPASALPTESAVDQASLALVPTTCSSSSPDVTSSSSSSSVTQYSPSGRSLRETPLIEEPSAAAMTPPAPRLGLLSRTRQFGAWISKATEGEKVEVSQKDLNTIVPNSF